MTQPLPNVPRREAVADFDEVSARDDQQAVA